MARPSTGICSSWARVLQETVTGVLILILLLAKVDLEVDTVEVGVESLLVGLATEGWRG